MAKYRIGSCPVPVGVVFLFFGFGVGLNAGTLVGTVVDRSDQPIRDAVVSIVELRRQTRVDRDGGFRFEDVPGGEVSLQVTSGDFGNKLVKVKVAAQGETAVNLRFDIEVHEDLTVTASLERKSISDVSQAVGVLNDEELSRLGQPTLGETLASQPGVSSSYFGPGASRPIIRGLGGDRVRILEGGIGTGDASSVSPDHAVSVETLSAERIEILRGPASLRYGSSAIGGVVNVVDNRIPEFAAKAPASGTVELRGDTVADQRTGRLDLNGGQGNLAWHADFVSTDTHDYQIPGHAELEEEGDHEEEEERPGILENSALESRKGSAGVSFVSERGFVGFSYTGFDSLYGVPGHGHGHEGEEEEPEGEEEAETVSIDLDQRRFDFRGGIQLDGTVKSLNLRAGSTDYEHAELEGAEVGTLFKNEFREARLEAQVGAWGSFTSGSFGFQYAHRDFEAIGEEAFVAPNETETLSAFFFEEMDRGSWSLSVGGRYDRQTNDGSVRAHGHHEGEEEEGEEEEEEPSFYNLSFSDVSGSFGFILGKETDWGLTGNLTYTQRAPNAEELFSNGPHLATRAFEVGNPELTSETSAGLDLQVRKKRGHVTGELSLFTNRFGDYIFERFTGGEEDGLAEFEFTQQDADFLGGEVHVDVTLLHREPHHWNLELTYDMVRAELDDGTPLPRIPPERLTLTLGYRQPSYWAKAELSHSGEQDRLAPLETPTADYTFFGLVAGARFFAGTTIHQILIRGTNLGDEEGRVHTSFLKDLSPLPGRNLTVSYRLSF